MTLSTDKQERKETPIFSGVLRYFPLALAAVAQVSKIGNDQHNPGQPLHWSRGKSDDHGDALARHLLEAGTLDTDGCLHSAKVAWRALALLQLECEANLVSQDVRNDFTPLRNRPPMQGVAIGPNPFYAECDRQELVPDFATDSEALGYRSRPLKSIMPECDKPAMEPPMPTTTDYQKTETCPF